MELDDIMPSKKKKKTQNVKDKYHMFSLMCGM